jgi:hypothetical protein
LSCPLVLCRVNPLLQVTFVIYEGINASPLANVPEGRMVADETFVVLMV